MTIPRNYKAFHGKENLMASINHWLMDTIEGGYLGVPPLPSNKDFFWAFDFPIIPQNTPAITTAEIGLFNLGEMALDRLMGFTDDGNPIYGTINQTLIEITCVDQDKEGYSASTKNVRNLRDKVMAAFTTENIPLKNYNSPSKPQIGIIRLDLNSNSVNEKFLVDPVNQNLKRYVLLIRLFWNELEQRATGNSLKSDTQIS
jgi:hypothetical protein